MISLWLGRNTSSSLLGVKRSLVELSKILREVSHGTREDPIRALFLLKASTSAFTIKNLLRH